jgi:N-glycosylase/DNA lyase
MERLIADVENLRCDVEPIVKKRIAEFLKMREKGNRDWFLELCFCILTANSSARMGIKAQNEIGDGFITLPFDELSKKLRELGHRFYRKRAEFIIEARKFLNIKEIVTSMKPFEARMWLKDSIKGIGMKEASHFMRNVGFLDFAILDRHILNVLNDYGIADRPKTLTLKKYFEIEGKLLEVAKAVGMRVGELDLYLWYMKTGEVLK